MQKTEVLRKLIWRKVFAHYTHGNNNMCEVKHKLLWGKFESSSCLKWCSFLRKGVNGRSTFEHKFEIIYALTCTINSWGWWNFLKRKFLLPYQALRELFMARHENFYLLLVYDVIKLIYLLSRQSALPTFSLSLSLRGNGREN